jgi:LAO/AO transport system kinase
MSNIQQLLAKITSRNRMALSKAITLSNYLVLKKVESCHNEHKKLASQLLTEIVKLPTNSFRIGLSGAPGVGKSSFIETFGSMLIKNGHKVAVLAVDPSSSRTGGSILVNYLNSK